MLDGRAFAIAVCQRHVPRGILWAGLLALQAYGAPPKDPPRIAAGRLPPQLRIDGFLNEPIWSQTPGIDGLTMTEPDEGGTPTARTTVRVLADAQELVLGGAQGQGSRQQI